METVLEFLTILELRKTWDFFLEDLLMVEGTAYGGVLHRKVKMLFYSAEFIEKQMVVHDEETVFVITYSAKEEEYPLIYNAKCDVDVLNAFVITERNGGTVITLINQMGHKSYSRYDYINLVIS